MSDLLASRRARLVAVLVVATAAVSVLAVSAAGGAFSYYVTPEEFAQQLDTEGKRWRVGGRVVEGTIVERNGRPVAWEIVGDGGGRMNISHESGPLPNLFGPWAFVVIDGEADGPSSLRASKVTIKHEDEFLKDDPTGAYPPPP